MLREEYRTHTKYSGEERFLTFPVFVFFLCGIVGLTLDKLTETVPLSDLATFAHLSAFMYGLSVGTFGLMGRQYLERRYGRSNYLVAMPYPLPISFKTTFLGIYLRDALFYVVLLLVPATAGLLFAAPLAGFSYLSIGLFFVASLTSFMLGLSLSFLASVIFIRSVKAFVAFALFVCALFLAYGALGLLPLEALIPSYGFQLQVQPFGSDTVQALLYFSAASIAILALTALAYSLVEVRINITSQTYPDKLPTYFEKLKSVKGLRRSLLAKEFVDLRRSNTVAKMFFSFVLPLLFLSFTVWFVNYGLAIPVGFNTVFYAAMVGFVGTLMYSWLNNIALVEYYSMLPVTVPNLIKVRIIVFLVLTLGISAFFVIGISIVNGETNLLWLALLVMFVTSLYMVVVMANLTGLKTNTFLFDTGILAKFSVMSFLPDVCLTILSFSLMSDWTFAAAGLTLVLGVMLFATWVLYRGIEKKWSRTPFTD